MNRRITALNIFPIAMAATLLPLARADDNDSWQGDFTVLMAEGDAGETIPCRLLRPPAGAGQPSEPTTLRYPLVIFLHGAGERGNDNRAQLKHGVAEFHRRRGQNPCFLLAPQCPSGDRWVEVDWDAASGSGTFPDRPSMPLRTVWSAVEKLLETEPIDADRIYVTGLSMGGYGTWFAAAHYRRRVAATSPVCGGGDPAWAERYLGLPMWAVHGIEDSAVPVERTREMVRAIREAGGSIGVTEYPGVGHDSWTPFYADDQFHRWLFAQRRTDPAPANPN